LNRRSASRRCSRIVAGDIAILHDRYAGGVDTYLPVIIEQTLVLTNQRNEADILRRQMDASVLLVKALGGGWACEGAADDFQPAPRPAVLTRELQTAGARNSYP